MKYCPLCKTELISKELNDAMRLLCASDNCDYVFWDNPTPVVGIIVEHDEDIILANNVGWPESWYSIITGFLEKGESPEQCGIREVKEELNLDVETISFVGVYSFLKFNQLIIAYHALANGDIKLNEELRAYKRIEKQQLRPWNSETGHAVRDWLAQSGYGTRENITFRLGQK